MAKRSNKRSPQQNKDQAGCMSGLISIFDFRHGRTTRRLLSDRLIPKNTVASTYPTSEVNLLTSSEERHASIENGSESEKPALDVVKTSVKELMEEEMVIEQASTNQTDGDEVELFDPEHGSHEKNHKHTEKTLNKAFENLDIAVSCQDSSQKVSQFSDLEALMKEILMIYQRRNDRQSDLDVGRNWTFSIVEEKLSAAVEVFMNEKLSNGDHEKTRRSKDFIDTFQMLSSNKELFLKLLQDQNPDTNANEDQKSMARSSSLENEPSNPRPDAPATRKHKNFFRRRSKSHESISLKGDDSPLHSNRIVILKPNSLDNQMKMENNDRNERISSHFSFMEIKKRLKNVMGKEQKEQRKPGFSEKTVVEGSSGWSSPNRDHFYTERFAKRIDRVSKLREPETEQNEKDENGDSSRQISSIYVEAKKHLSEMLSGDDEDVKLMIESLPKALGKILSFPEYDSISPGSSPRKENDHGFVTEKTRLSSCGDFLMDDKSHPCASSIDLEDELRVSDEVNHDVLVGGIPATTMEDMSLEGGLRIEKTGNQEEVEILDVPCEPCSSLETVDDDRNGEIVEISDEERSPQCLKSDSLEENEFSSPMGSSLAKKIEEPESNASDKSERPSPISVLEPLFSDNDEISPASTISRPVEAAIQPLCIRFEDQETCSRICSENEESAFEYVEAVLLASDLNWDEFEKRWLSSVQILDSSLFDDVEIFSSRPSHDQRLLFDSTNEILKQVCDHYLNFYLQLSFIKQNVQPVPKGENLINEVWERIELHLKNNYPLSLDRLVKKDLGISKTWMDLRSNSREIVFEIDERIFEDVMDDTLVSLVNDCIHDES
ncbi:hypothetical protein L6452_33216 [Arctium lappa]|uniref:Uncharacterized protein n=1 Tax=Arctium lappa TaxID=4217 RepID=A0ACB8Z6P1_ARCLA|nr:hypothetical protein L6452_33216 [Arctium lappa]